MHFTKLRLQGFKSFVDPTDLVIMDGLTGVVGPNGCGKSNLLEALRWVMGESRPTQMRGGGMEDVIFAGADSRAAKHFAEVTLFLDNHDRTAPTAFNHSDELDIIRRITRDIGSAYKVNGKDARARDVAMMFADAATGAHSPSLVRQGQISELINAKPQARRRVLEDAAGISGLYQRRHEAELKLKGAETNLLRVDDVLEQLAGQMRSLDRQAKAAARYKEISADLRAVEAIRAYIEWKVAAERAVEAERIVGEARTERASAESVRLETEKAQIEAQEALPALRDEEAIAGALVQRLQLAFDNLTDEEARAHTQIAELARMSETLASDRAREMQIEHDAAEAMERLKWEEDQIAEASEGEEDAILAAAEKARLAHETLSAAEAKFDEMRQDLAREEARAQAAERRFNEAESRKSGAAEALEKVEADSASTNDAFDHAQTDLELKSGLLASAQSAIGGFEEMLAKGEEANHAAGEKLDQLRAERSEVKGALSAMEAERRGLEASLNSNKAGTPVIDKIKVDAGFEAALGAALDAELEAPLAKDGSGWQELGSVDLASWPAGATPLSEHVRGPSALERRLGFIAVCEGADAAMIKALKPGQRLVSKSGDLWRWDGFVRLAEDGESASALQLQQRNRLADINGEIEGLEAKRDEIDAESAKAEKLAEEARASFQNNQNARRQAEQALTEAIRNHHAAENELERLSARHDMLQSALNHRREELEIATAEQTDAAANRIDPEQFESQKTELETHRIAVEDARTAMLEERAEVDELRKAREHRQKRLGDIEREKTGWNKRLENTSSHQSELSRRIEENEAARKAAAALPAELEQKRVLLEADITNAQSRLNAAKEAHAAGESARAKADQAHREAEAKLADIREKLARSEMSFESAVTDRDEAESEIKEGYNQTPEDLGAALQEDGKEIPPLHEVEDKINKLIRAREGLGAVNLRAEEDRREVAEEHDKLEADKAEITEAISKLRQAIAALNKEGRERLLAAFDEVNANFKMLFTKLFGGGDASLELVESDDPLNAGLEIMCQPPGKKLSTLSLLSGGEQTLTALSLIFAVFLTNPSPICVLDEVDAPLDDANVTRFCDILDEMTRQTQTRFLIITHHALTMSRMDRLFGVTMAEKGVSQLVSVNLKEAEEMVAD